MRAKFFLEEEKIIKAFEEGKEICLCSDYNFDSSNVEKRFCEFEFDIDVFVNNNTFNCFDDHVLTKEDGQEKNDFLTYRPFSILGTLNKYSSCFLRELENEFCFFDSLICGNNSVSELNFHDSSEIILNITKNKQQKSGGFSIETNNGEGEIEEISFAEDQKEDSGDEKESEKEFGLDVVPNPHNLDEDSIDEILEKLWVVE